MTLAIIAAVALVAVLAALWWIAAPFLPPFPEPEYDPLEQDEVPVSGARNPDPS